LSEKLDEQWRELRRHATIEKDPEKLGQLVAKLDKRKRHAEPMGKRDGN